MSNESFADVLGEACGRMVADHEARAADAEWWADRAERFARRPASVVTNAAGAVLFWEALAARWRRDAAEQRELAGLYRWYEVALGGPGVMCSCRGPRRPCPHTPPAATLADGEYLQTYPLPHSFEIVSSW